MAGMRLNVGQSVGAVWQLLWRLLEDSICRNDDALRVMLVDSQPGRVASLAGAVNSAALQGMRLGAVSCSSVVKV